MSPNEPSFAVRDKARPLTNSLLRVTKVTSTTASQTQARGVKRHVESHIDESMGHKISFDQDTVTSKVSWSDTDGSTYESEHYHQENGSLTVRSSNSKDNGINMFPQNVKSLSSKPESNQRLPETTKITARAATNEVQVHNSLRPISSESPRLQHVDYYSYVDVASTNDGLSSVGFISKEDTRPIFCRRMVPLEVPVHRRFHDDVSAFSSCDPPSVMPTGDSLSVQVVHTRRATTELTREAGLSQRNTMHDYVDCLPDIEIASPDHDISTITCRVSRQIAASAFHDKQNEDMELGSLTSGALDGPLINKQFACHNRMDSISTLGSTSVTSAASDAQSPSSFDAEYDTGSSTKSTPTKIVKPSIVTVAANRESGQFCRVAKYSNVQDDDLEHSLQTDLRRQSQETTNQRIRILKERIKQMQVASTMETLPDTRKILPTLTESSERTTESSRSTSHDVGPGMRNQHLVESRGHRQSPNVDPWKPEEKIRLHVVVREVDVQKRFQIHEQDLSASILTVRNSLNSENTIKRGEVPSVVTPIAHDGDDISTIHCDVGYTGGKDFVDVDLEGGVYGRKNSGPAEHATSSVRGAVKGFRAIMIMANSLARQANTSLEYCPGYQKVKTSVAGLWMKYVHGRSRTEQAILGVILLSFSILFILVISLISG